MMSMSTNRLTEPVRRAREKGRLDDQADGHSGTNIFPPEEKAKRILNPSRPRPVLRVRKPALPEDQRLFFGTICPSFPHSLYLGEQ